MKKCPTCGNTFDDGLRFCQTDGTPLIEAAGEARQSDPFQSVVSFQDDSETETKVRDRMDTSVSDASPTSSFDSFGSLGKPGFPKFSEPGLSSPSFGDLASPESNLSSSSPKSGNDSGDATLVFDSKGIPEDYSTGFDPKPLPNDPPTQNSAPIPSPFENPRSTGYEPPSYKEPEPDFGGQSDPFNQTPFGQAQTPFGNASNPYNPAMQQGNWAPVPTSGASEWQDQGFGGNAQFQPPMGAAQGQNQTLAIISLVLGLISIPCCGSVVLGLGALVTGYLAKKKADQNPAEYGGGNLALAGMIIGAITTVVGFIFIILQVFLGIFQ
jgi:hypothetical protein